MLGRDLANDVWIRTFHSFCWHIWKNDPGKLIIENEEDFATEELTKVYQMCYQINRLQYHKFVDDKEILNTIKQWEKQRISSEGISNQQAPQICVDVYKKYKQILEEKDKDILEDSSNIFTKTQLFTNALLRDVPEVRTKWQEKFELIFVDEFQDTDPIQYEIIKSLAGEHTNLRVVGDDDQSIYGWRGADIQNILNFENDYSTAKKPITLGQNYRSTRKIVEASRALAEFNPDRREKDLFTRKSKDTDPKVIHLHCENGEEEAATIADFIARSIKDGREPRDFTILCRSTKSQSPVFEEAFKYSGIPLHVVEDLSDIPTNKVSIMTIHKSKGLEFPNVFVAGVCSGLLPHYNSKEEDWGEELRLLYVAMTRAKNWLCLSSYEVDTKHKRGRSPFLKYIPKSLLESVKTLANTSIPPHPNEMKTTVPEEPPDYEPLPEKLLGSGMTVIGIDPGNIGARETNVGWSVTQKVSDGYSVLDHNTEHPIGNKEDRLEKIEHTINRLVALYSPDAIAVEKLEVATRKAKEDWFLYVAGCVAAISTIADRHGIECRRYTPQEVKYAATGDKQADKAQVEQDVKKQSNLIKAIRTDHEADAIAVSLCYLRSHLNSSRFEGNKRKQKCYETGCDYLNRGQYDAAASKFQEAINIDPIYTNAHCGLGRAYIGQGDLETAENAAKTALRLGENNHPDSQKLLNAIKCYRLGCNFVNNNQFDEAIIVFQESINMEPIFIQAHCGLSRAYLGVGNLEAAKNVVQKSLRFRDNHPPVQNLSHAIGFYNAGLNFLNDRRYNDAIDKLKEAIDKEPIFIQAHYRLGLVYFENGTLEASEQSANDTLELNTNYQPALALLDNIRRAYVDMGYEALEELDLTEAEKYANKAFLIDEDCQLAHKLFESIKQAYYKQACDYLSNKQYSKAISEFNKLISKDPNFIDAYCGLSKTYLGQRSLREAQHYANEVLKLEKNYQPALQVLKDIRREYYERGMSYLGQGDLISAEKSAKEVLRYDPNCQLAHNLLEAIKQAYYNRGHDHLNNRRYDEAITAFEETIDKYPDFTVVYCGLSQAYLGKGNLAAAANSAKEALRLESNCQLALLILENVKQRYCELGTDYLKQWNLIAAENAANGALELDNDYQPAYMLLENVRQAYYESACNHLGNQQFGEAIATFKVVVDRYPNFTEAHCGLAQAYLEQGDDLTAAKVSVQNALRIDPDYPVALALLEGIMREYYNRSIALIDVGEYITAIDLLLEVDGIDPNNKEVCTNLADTYCLMGDDVEAANWYQKLIDIDPNDKIAYIELGNACYNMGEYEKAVSSFQGASELDPKCEKAYNYWKRADFKLQKDREMESDQMIRIPGDKYINEFYIDIYLVTNAEYKVFVDQNPEWHKERVSSCYDRSDYLTDWNGGNYPQGKDNHPVTYVDWYAAMAYALWLEKRLPTEAEWEKASRGHGGIKFVENYPLDHTSDIWEWCLNEHNSNSYGSSGGLNPIVGADNADEIVSNFKNVKTSRVARVLNSSKRRGNSPSFANFNYGFRCMSSGID